MPSWTISRKEAVFDELSVFKIRYEDGHEPENWYYELKVGKKRRRKSTKKASISEAIDIAKEAYFEARGLERAGLNPHQTDFRRVAAEYLKDLKENVATGYEANSKFVRHQGVIENYLVEYFRTTPVADLNEKLARKYREWRRTNKRSTLGIDATTKRMLKARREWEKTGDIEYLKRAKGIEEALRMQSEKAPSPATMNTEMTVLRAVLKFAVQREYLAKFPEISNLSLKGQRISRPAFTASEMRKLIEAANIQRHSNEPIDAVSRYYRHLLYHFIRFGFLTGLRTKEQFVLRYADIVPYNNGTLINVAAEIEGAGKTGARRVIASSDVLKITQEIRQISDFTSDRSFLFCHPKASTHTGKAISSFKKGWAQLMEVSRLEKDSGGNKRTPYSLRHTHINEMLQSGSMTLYQLAMNVGNSPDIITKHYGKGVAFDGIDTGSLLKIH